MIGLFMDCEKLTSLDLSSFNTSAVNDMRNMFSGCSNLVVIYASDDFTIDNVTSSANMFTGCDKLRNFNSEYVDDTRANLTADGYLTYYKPYASFDSSTGTLTFRFGAQPGDFDYLLKDGTATPGWSANASSITTVVFDESFAAARPTSCYEWFKQCNNLTSIVGLSNLDTSEVTNMQSMFKECSSLTSLDLSSFNTSNVTNMAYVFYYCIKLESLDLSYSFKTSNVTDMQSMFRDCRQLGALDLSSFNTSNVTYMNSLFKDCWKLTSLDLGDSFNTSKVTNMASMFQDCRQLVSLDLSTFDTSKAIYMQYMFFNSQQLVSLDLRNFDFSNEVVNITDIFKYCDNLRLVDMSKAIDCSKIVSLIEQNALVYVPAGTTVDEGRANVVIGSECAHLVINYGTTDNNQNLLSVPYGFTAGEVTINRNFAAGTPYSLYVPFAISATDYGTFYTYDGYRDDKVWFNPLPEGTDATEANKPYMFKPRADYADGIVITGPVTVEPTPAAAEEPAEGYIGVYQKKEFTQAEVDSKSYYGWAGSEFQVAGQGASVDACRAYFRMPAAAAFKAPARIAGMFGDGTTGITDAVGDAATDDDDRDAPAYNLNGQRVDDGYRGIVVKKGKKILRR